MKFWLAQWGVSVVMMATALADLSTNGVVRLEGRVAPAKGAGTNLLFRTVSNGNLRLKRNPMSEALFVDTNLWSKNLLLTGKIQEQTFEVTGNLRSKSNGKVNELYYYCDICSISSSVPGLCQCCREPSRLVEEPAR